jgi:hypothetical protein
VERQFASRYTLHTTKVTINSDDLPIQPEDRCIKVRRRDLMANQFLQIESIDRLTDETFVLNFSDETVAILTEQELLEEFLDRRITAKGFTYMLSA